MNKIDLDYLNTNYFNLRDFLHGPFYENHEIKFEIETIFQKRGWNSMFISPKFLLDHDGGCLGFDKLHHLEGESASEKIAFVSTEFGYIWEEPYDSKLITTSEKWEWGLASSGVCIIPHNEKWFSLYVDRSYSDFIILSSDSDFISKVIKNIDPKLILF